MRSQSQLQKNCKHSELNYHSGFTSDYYSYHNLEKRKTLKLKKYSFTKNEDLSLEHSEKQLKHHKRILCMPIGFQFEIPNIIADLKTYLNLNSELNSILLEQIKSLTIFKFKNNSEKLIFLFEFGVIILWSFEESEEKEIIDIFYNNCKYVIINKNYDAKLNEEDANIFFLKKGEVFNIYNRNKITIESSDFYEILSVAYAIGQHTILSHYENEVALTIEETKIIPIEMRDKGQINLSKKEISRNIGLIFMRRSAVNLNSGIIDTPDIFWEQKTEIEVYYSTVRKYLEIDKRVEVLDRRMKILKELYDVMNNEIKTQGKFRLEWIVVYLIVIEIFISIFWKMLVKDILKLY